MRAENKRIVAAINAVAVVITALMLAFNSDVGAGLAIMALIAGVTALILAREAARGP